MRAVIFGYFGTLTDPGAEEYREPLAHRTGELLGVCRPRFWEALAGSFGERTIGVHGGTESTLRAVALSCGANPSSAQLPVALAHHRSGHARLCKPRHHALGVLAELRRRGLRIGLLSDCGAELAECWSPTAFVPLVFSWQERCRKPDPRLHAPVARRLAVHPEKCSSRTRWSRARRGTGSTPMTRSVSTRWTIRPACCPWWAAPGRYNGRHGDPRA